MCVVVGVDVVGGGGNCRINEDFKTLYFGCKSPNFQVLEYEMIGQRHSK